MGETNDDGTAAPMSDKQLQIKVNYLEKQLAHKADKTEVQHQAGIMQAKVDDCNDNINRLQQLIEDVRINCDKLRDDFNSFLEKAHEQLKDRVYTLEKKVTNLYSRGSDMSADIPEGMSDSHRDQRATAMEGELNTLRDEMMQLLNQMQE